MKRNRWYLLLLAACCMPGMSCSPKLANGNYSYHTECLGIGPDGLLSLKAWGAARTRPKALPFAEQNAVNELLFSGIGTGKAECGPGPLITELNAREQYRRFFDLFLGEGGEYVNFVSLVNKGGEQEIKAEHRNNYYGFVLRVDREGLKRYLLAKGILKVNKEDGSN